MFTKFIFIQLWVSKCTCDKKRWEVKLLDYAFTYKIYSMRLAKSNTLKSGDIRIKIKIKKKICSQTSINSSFHYNLVRQSRK